MWSFLVFVQQCMTRVLFCSWRSFEGYWISFGIVVVLVEVYFFAVYLVFIPNNKNFVFTLLLNMKSNRLYPSVDLGLNTEVVMRSR